MKQYKIRVIAGQTVAFVRNGGAWIPKYAGYSHDGHDLAKHWSTILESAGYSKK